MSTAGEVGQSETDRMTRPSATPALQQRMYVKYAAGGRVDWYNHDACTALLSPVCSRPHPKQPEDADLEGAEVSRTPITFAEDSVAEVIGQTVGVVDRSAKMPHA